MGMAWVEALAKPDNEASRRAFADAGFREIGATEVRGSPAVRLRYEGPLRQAGPETSRR